MTKITTANYLIEKLKSLGISEVFGLPGDYNFELIEAVEKNENINWIGNTNELNAGYCADGYARIKGYGAIITTYGVGELSAINAIAGSMAENVPVIKIVGVPAEKFIEKKALIHHNLTNADYRAFERAYSNVVETTAFLNKQNTKAEIDRLINTMVKTKKPVYVAIPMDVALYEFEYENYEIIQPKSNEQTLKKVTTKIIEQIKKSKNPIVIAGILANRFNAKKELNNFLTKTKIPSTSFLRGMDIIRTNTKNYLGPYCGRCYNEICYKYLNNSDCIISFGAVISDLNTRNFDFDFDINDTINIQPEFTIIKGEKYENVLIKDVINNLFNEIDYIFSENLVRTLKYKKTDTDKKQTLTSDYIYSKLNNFIKQDDIIVAEVGLSHYGIVPFELPDNVSVQNQILWGSIGWATPCAMGCAIADRKKRTILITGDGAHQLTAVEVGAMMRNNLKPIIFVLNNSGYTIERILCKDPNYKYNDIAHWNYIKLPEVFKGNFFSAKITTNEEFDKILPIIEQEQKEKLCYIELCLNYLDVPYYAQDIIKYPELIKNIKQN